MNSSFSEESKNAFSLANSAWNNASGAPFYITRLTTDNSATSLNRNDKNEVFKEVAGTNYFIMSTNTYYTNGKVVEFDIIVNTSYTWANNGSSSAYDIQNAATHEIGHALFSGDLYGSDDTEKTMYGYAALGETKKRTLESDDISGFAASN